MRNLTESSGVAAGIGGLRDARRRAASLVSRLMPEIRSRLFRKYVWLFVAVVCIALVVNGGFQIWFFDQQHNAALFRIQEEQAQAASAKIGRFIKEIESQLGWTVQLPWTQSTLPQRRIDAWRLFRQVPAVAELVQIDANGREQIHVSRRAPDVTASGIDFSKDPRYLEAIAHKSYYGQVYFRNESEPYMSIAIAGDGATGVTIAEVNLKLIWDVVSQIKVGEHGYAYVVDARGRLIAHPDLSLVLSKRDLSSLDQVKAAQAADTSEPVHFARDIEGRPVLTSFAPITPPGWLVFIELPTDEAYAPLWTSIWRTLIVLLAALALAILAGMFLARRMIVPIQALRAGAARIGSGDLYQRIAIKTGDELESLADQFNDMADRLRESYANLEKKVEMRTRELAQSVEELQALGEVSQAVNSTLDLETVLNTIVAKAVQISDTDAGTIYVYDETRDEFALQATHGMTPDLIAAVGSFRMRIGELIVGRATAQHVPIQAPDLSELPSTPLQQIIIKAGFNAVLAMPLLSPDRIVGALVVRRRQRGVFTRPTIELLQTFAAQSVLAIQNARIFQELEDKSRQLELESKHKSQFLANMSHELRTPLNAILGYTELILDNIYGETPEKMRSVLDRVQANGRHLLGLINDVLDLSKIEAGQLTLSLSDYSLSEVVQNVYTSLEALAAEKHLGFRLELPPDLPRGRGDERRIMQVLLNLTGNAIKFTDTGEITITASAHDGAFTVAVRDTGPGVGPADQVRIFAEFQQVDASSTRTKGGSGLGLSIAQRIVDLHGGRIWVESRVGMGSTFAFTLPIMVQWQAA